MHQEGFNDYYLSNIINKMKKLRQKYKVESDKKKRTGRSRGKTWKFFDSLHEILGHRPNVQPSFILDTAKVQAKDGSDDKSGDEEGKYGTLII